MLVNRKSLFAKSRLDPSLQTGVPFIDEEHLELISQLDLLTTNPHAHPRSEAFSEILSRLGGQISSHFSHEESFIERLAMPSEVVESHVQAHHDILIQYAELNIDLMHGKPLGRPGVLLMIKGWVLDHVTTHDILIREYLVA